MSVIDPDSMLGISQQALKSYKVMTCVPFSSAAALYSPLLHFLQLYSVFFIEAYINLPTLINGWLVLICIAQSQLARRTQRSYLAELFARSVYMCQRYISYFPQSTTLQPPKLSPRTRRPYFPTTLPGRLTLYHTPQLSITGRL